MTSRYSQRKVVRNQSEMYKSLFEKRGIKYINQFKTAKLSYPTKKEMATLNDVLYTWKAGDKYFKLAHQFYGDATAWWIIAWYNRAPTEADIRPGQPIYIPQPLDKILPILMRNV